MTGMPDIASLGESYRDRLERACNVGDLPRHVVDGVEAFWNDEEIDEPPGCPVEVHERGDEVRYDVPSRNLSSTEVSGEPPWKKILWAAVIFAMTVPICGALILSAFEPAAEMIGVAPEGFGSSGKSGEKRIHPWTWPVALKIVYVGGIGLMLSLFLALSWGLARDALRPVFASATLVVTTSGLDYQAGLFGGESTVVSWSDVETVDLALASEREDKFVEVESIGEDRCSNAKLAIRVASKDGGSHFLADWRPPAEVVWLADRLRRHAPSQNQSSEPTSISHSYE